MSGTAEVLISFVTLIAVANSLSCAEIGVNADLTIVTSSGTPFPSSSVPVELANPFTLLCFVSPTRNITGYEWYQNDVQLVETSQSLSISSVEGGDGGIYRCKANINTSAACTTQDSDDLTLLTTPDIIVRYPSDIMIHVREGDAFELQCEATAWPVPSLQWLKENAGVVSMIGNYTVASARLSDDGAYFCEARNPNGVMRQTRVVRIIPVTTAVGGSEVTVGFIQRSSNGTDSLGFYIGVGVAAGVGLGLSSLTLICCFFILYINFCRSIPAKEHNPYEDWPDGNDQEAMAQVRKQQPAQLEQVEVVPRCGERKKQGTGEVSAQTPSYAEVSPTTEEDDRETVPGLPTKSEVGEMI